ncbi:MAG TPA: hypothetical protein VLW44_03755 [Streptosporangiaceae bacterium]|nr:hypothetical protein [Streptosporangiaceae bacterium]
MDLTSAQRKIAFAVIVLALAGLGAFLLWPRPSPAPSQAAGPTARAAASTPAQAPVSPAAAASPVPSGPAVNIYQLLPFSQADLTQAAGVVRQFCADYATYSYTESASNYVSRMGSLVTPSLAATLAQDYATPGVAQARTRQKQSATGSGAITALRAFGPSSLTFLVTLNQKTYSTQRTGKTSAQTLSTSYAITAAQSGSGWQVNDIQLASAGNS